MTLKLNHRKSINRLSKNEKGFLLPLALFMIVVASGGVLLMSKYANDSVINMTLTVTSNQSLYAAETGAQLAANQLFFPMVTRQQVDARCDATSIDQGFSLDGLDQCRIIVNCTCRHESGDRCDSAQIANYSGATATSDSFYHVESIASCGSGSSLGRHRVTLDKKFQ